MGWQVVQESVLRAKLMELNTRDGRPWLYLEPV
jgi:hypothetical protein